MVVYSHTVSPRLHYVINFLSQYYRQQIALITNATEFASTEGTRINYSNENLFRDAFWIQPSGLLFEDGIKSQAPQCFEHPAGYTAFFKTEGRLGFDLFSAMFFLLSLYEEYLPHRLDSYGRYAHQNSLAFNEGFLQQPLVNIWLEYLRNKVEEKSGERLPLPQFFFLPTYDIDMAWSYKHKGFLRNVGGIARSVIKADFLEVKRRASVIAGLAPDPYDAFDWMDALHQKYDMEPVYFFHVGQQRNQYDKNIPTKNYTFRKLVKSIAKKYKLGLHPSWHSGDAHQYVDIEKTVLENIIHKPVTASRQHYIRFSMPGSFRRLLCAGITEDYSMGYGTVNGFRASVAFPFYWYDLEKEEQTDLLIHPFCYMDANSYFELHHTPKQAFEEMMHYYREVKKVNGMLCILWHNTFLGTDPLFEGWQEVYESFIKKVTEGKKAITSF